MVAAREPSNVMNHGIGMINASGPGYATRKVRAEL